MVLAFVVAVGVLAHAAMSQSVQGWQSCADGRRSRARRASPATVLLQIRSGVWHASATEQPVDSREVDERQTTPAGSMWLVESVGRCESSLGCIRGKTVACVSFEGEPLPDGSCDRGERPVAHEQCVVVGGDVCVDIAPSDCMDLPGCWWNQWGKSCGALQEAGACSARSVESGWSSDDVALMQRACPASCGYCSPRRSVQNASMSCACEDDAEYRTASGNPCSWHLETGQSCAEQEHADELKAACPMTCGLCG